MTHDALIYVRQSAAKEESISLETQETSARDHCARHGYRVVDVISDPGVSGLKWDRREGVQRLLKRVEAGDADRVIVWRWSRLSRRSVHQHLAIDRIESAGALVESSTEPFDTKTAGGAFGRDVMLASAAFESKQKSEQWLDAHHHRLQNGLPAAGGERFGYTWHPGTNEHYDIDEQEAEIVRWLYSSYISGRGIASLVRELNRLGATSKQDRQWNRSALLRYLESGFAAGLLVKTGTGVGDNRKEVPFTDREFLTGAHAPIIDQDTWQQFHTVKRQRAQTPPRHIHRSNPLSGLVRCGDCGGAMTRHVNGTGRPHKQVSYTCSNRNRGMLVRSCRIPEATVYRVVFDWLSDVAEDVGDSARKAQSKQQARLRSQVTAEDSAKNVADIDSQLENLTKQLVAGRVPESAYDATRDSLLRDRKQAEEQRELAEAEAAQRGDETPHVTARELINGWDTLTAHGANDVLRKLIREVRVVPSEQPYGRSSAVVVSTWD